MSIVSAPHGSIRYWARHFTELAKTDPSDDRQLEFSNQAVTDQTYAFVLEACGQLAGKRVLDCGFGTGELSRAMDGLGATVDAIDVVSARIPQLREEAPSIYWSAAELSNWKLPRNVDAYDVIVACEVLQYVDFDAVVDNMLRALDSRGRLVIMIPNADCPHVMNVAKRFDSQYMGVSEADLQDRLARYCQDYHVTYRGIRYQKDQTLVPLVSDPWTRLTTERHTVQRPHKVPPTRLQIAIVGGAAN